MFASSFRPKSETPFFSEVTGIMQAFAGLKPCRLMGVNGIVLANRTRIITDLKDCILNHLPFVEALSHVVKIKSVCDIVFELFDKFDVDIRLDECCGNPGMIILC